MDKNFEIRACPNAPGCKRQCINKLFVHSGPEAEHGSYPPISDASEASRAKTR